MADLIRVFCSFNGGTSSLSLLHSPFTISTEESGQAGASPGCSNVKRLGVFLLPWTGASPSRGHLLA